MNTQLPKPDFSLHLLHAGPETFDTFTLRREQNVLHMYLTNPSRRTLHLPDHPATIQLQRENKLLFLVGNMPINACFIDYLPNHTTPEFVVVSRRFIDPDPKVMGTLLSMQAIFEERKNGTFLSGFDLLERPELAAQQNDSYTAFLYSVAAAPYLVTVWKLQQRNGRYRAFGVFESYSLSHNPFTRIGGDDFFFPYNSYTGVNFLPHKNPRYLFLTKAMNRLPSDPYDEYAAPMRVSVVHLDPLDDGTHPPVEYPIPEDTFRFSPAHYYAHREMLEQEKAHNFNKPALTLQQLRERIQDAYDYPCFMVASLVTLHIQNPQPVPFVIRRHMDKMLHIYFSYDLLRPATQRKTQHLVVTHQAEAGGFRYEDPLSISQDERFVHPHLPLTMQNGELVEKRAEKILYQLCPFYHIFLTEQIFPLLNTQLITSLLLADGE